MDLGIDWIETLSKWKSSKGDCELIEDVTIIEGVATLLKIFSAEAGASKVIVRGDKVMRAIRTDSVNKYELLEIGATQLIAHKKAWRTHIKLDSNTDNLTVEFPIVIQGISHLRYFKVIMLNGKTKLHKPKEIEKIYVHYHTADEPVEVIYYV